MARNTKTSMRHRADFHLEALPHEAGSCGFGVRAVRPRLPGGGIRTSGVRAGCVTSGHRGIRSTAEDRAGRLGRARLPG
jgi:hypothetical protein